MCVRACVHACVCVVVVAAVVAATAVVAGAAVVVVAAAAVVVVVVVAAVVVVVAAFDWRVSCGVHYLKVTLGSTRSVRVEPVYMGIYIR